MSTVAYAFPTKQFFIRMITRDIRLEDCILDLIDNSLDGATRVIHGRSEQPPEHSKYSGFEVEIDVNGLFAIRDNCGGIGVELAKNHAFHFGRKPQRASAPAAAEASPSEITAANQLKAEEEDFMIGLYGIGMKRAIFKLGEKIEIRSATAVDAFTMEIDVAQWGNADEWQFIMNEVPPWEPAGTEIKIPALTAEAAARFKDSVFVNEFRQIIARDYSLFLQKGLAIKVNGEPVPARPYGFIAGAEIEPFSQEYVDDGVKVHIAAGVAEAPPDDSDPDAAPRDPSLFGWFVVCNERVVLAADKTERTVWSEDFKGWHSQYNGFAGFASFSAKGRDAIKLPWTTTKRDLNVQNPIYQRAVARMKTVTERWTSYTNQRKQDLQRAKELELTPKIVPLGEVTGARLFKLPTLTVKRREVTTISYTLPKTEVRKVAAALGDENMPATQVGLQTFRYFQKREMGE